MKWKANFPSAFGYPYLVSWKAIFQVFSVILPQCHGKPFFRRFRLSLLGAMGNLFSGDFGYPYSVSWKAFFQAFLVILSVMESLFSSTFGCLCSVSWKALFYDNITKEGFLFWSRSLK